MSKLLSLIVMLLFASTTLVFAQFPSAPSDNINNIKKPRLYDPNDMYTEKAKNVSKIKYKIVREGGRFYQGNNKLNWRELKNRLGGYPEFKSAKINRSIGLFLSGIGGYLIGFGLASNSNFDGDPNWPVVGIGGIAALISFPIYQKSINQIEIITHKYNQKIQSTSSLKDAYNLSITASQGGIGLKLNF